jgi:hypothetical protein
VSLRAVSDRAREKRSVGAHDKPMGKERAVQNHGLKLAALTAHMQPKPAVLRLR